MKQISLDRLKRLKQEGWDIPGEDQSKIISSKSKADFENAVKSITKSLEHIAGVSTISKNNAVENNKQIRAALDAQFILLKNLTVSLNMPRAFQVDITKRNKQGYISQVIVKQIKDR